MSPLRSEAGARSRRASASTSRCNTTYRRPCHSPVSRFSLRGGSSPPGWWRPATAPGVRLATSFGSAVTVRPGTVIVCPGSISMHLLVAVPGHSLPGVRYHRAPQAGSPRKSDLPRLWISCPICPHPVDNELAILGADAAHCPPEAARRGHDHRRGAANNEWHPGAAPCYVPRSCDGLSVVRVPSGSGQVGRRRGSWRKSWRAAPGTGRRASPAGLGRRLPTDEFRRIIAARAGSRRLGDRPGNYGRVRDPGLGPRGHRRLGSTCRSDGDAARSSGRRCAGSRCAGKLVERQPRALAETSSPGTPSSPSSPGRGTSTRPDHAKYRRRGGRPGQPLTSGSSGSPAAADIARFLDDARSEAGAGRGQAATSSEGSADDVDEPPLRITVMPAAPDRLGETSAAAGPAPGRDLVTVGGQQQVARPQPVPGRAGPPVTTDATRRPVERSPRRDRHTGATGAGATAMPR